MDRTDEMVAAEAERLDLLHTSEAFLDIAKNPGHSEYVREKFLAESIKALMIGSHAGRIG